MTHRSLRTHVIAVCMLLPTCAAAFTDSPSLLPAFKEQPDRRLIVMVSDLHMGVGRTEKNPATGAWTNGRWHLTEDFRWAPEFALFIDEMMAWAKHEGVPADLIIVGDFLEMWQAVGHSCGLGGVRNLGCSELQALERLERIIGAHGPVFESLRKFANAGRNRVIVIPGNHDAALVFDQVAARVKAAVGAKTGRVRVAKEGYWLSADGHIFVEHGHQMEGDMNKFPDYNRPAVCLDKDETQVPCNGSRRKAYLLRTAGENFVQAFYNQFEEQFPVIDNLAKLSLGVWRGIESSSLAEVAWTFLGGLKFLALDQSFEQAMQSLGDEADAEPPTKPQWNYDAIRPTGPEFLVGSLPPGSSLREKAETFLRTGELSLKEYALSNREIDRLCRLREAFVAEGSIPKTDRCPTVGLEPQQRLGAAASALFFDEDELLRDHLEQRRIALHPESAPQSNDGNFTVFIYGHTHKAKAPRSPFEAQADWRPTVVNTGAWQRVATPRQLEHIERRLANMKGLQPDDPTLFPSLRPEDLPACYSYVVIAPYDPAVQPVPKPRLLFWARSTVKNEWGEFASCPSDPAIGQ